MLLPERLRADQQGVFQHIDGRTELLSQSGAHHRLHQLFSHNGHFFPLFFCYATTKSGQKLTCIYNFIIQQISSYSCFSFPGMLDRFPKKFGLTHIFYFVLNPGKFSAWLLLPAKR
jgi:hypothetical protein